jgi:hypothetical protein
MKNQTESHLENLYRNQCQHRPDVVRDPLYVITTVFNPQRFRTRWKLYNNFEKHILDSGAILYTIEAAFGEREAVYTEEVSDRHKIIHVRTKSEIWIKENLINLAAQFLPQDWKYMAWIDADVQFIRQDWVGETIQQLQHYDFLQLFSIAIDLTPKFDPYCFNYSFMHDYINGHEFWGGQTKPNNPDSCVYYTGSKRSTNTSPVNINRWHPGFAWGCTREAFSKMGGLIDKGILGAGDHHMALSLIGKARYSLPSGISQEYKDMVLQWEERAIKEIKYNVGYVDGSIVHFFHGAKVNRRYIDRWKILSENQYNPLLDLKRDWNGVYQLTDRNYKLRDEIRNYFRQRDEDNLDMMGVKDLLGR